MHIVKEKIQKKMSKASENFFQLCCKSQNHRLAEVGSDFQSHLVQQLLHSRGPTHSLLLRTVSRYLCRLIKLSGHPVSAFSHAHGEKVFPEVQTESLTSTTPRSCYWAPQQRACLHHFAPSLRNLYALIDNLLLEPFLH